MKTLRVESGMTHAELVTRAVRWLKRTRRCPVVVSRSCMATIEQPDAIGWGPFGRSILVECKASIADYLRDAKKPWRAHPEMGMGNYRYFMTPPGLLAGRTLPDGWGLVECVGRSVAEVREPVAFIRWNQFEEIHRLVSRLKHGPEPWELPPRDCDRGFL